LRLNQTSLGNHRHVFAAGGGVRLKTRFTGRQEDMRGRILLNARRQRHNEHCVGALMAISRVKRDDHNRPSPLLGWIGWKLKKPNLAADWSSRS
jgi:hypothetical protein